MRPSSLTILVSEAATPSIFLPDDVGVAADPRTALGLPMLSTPGLSLPDSSWGRCGGALDVQAGEGQVRDKSGANRRERGRRTPRPTVAASPPPKKRRFGGTSKRRHTARVKGGGSMHGLTSSLSSPFPTGLNRICGVHLESAMVSSTPASRLTSRQDSALSSAGQPWVWRGGVGCV